MVVRLYNDMIQVIDSGQVGALVLLDMSAAFDTVDHQIMSDVLHYRFDIRDDALTWFHSYFDESSQVVSVGSDTSAVMKLFKSTIFMFVDYKYALNLKAVARKSPGGHTTNASLLTDVFHKKLIQI